MSLHIRIDGESAHLEANDETFSLAVFAVAMLLVMPIGLLLMPPGHAGTFIVPSLILVGGFLIKRPLSLVRGIEIRRDARSIWLLRSGRRQFYARVKWFEYLKVEEVRQLKAGTYFVLWLKTDTEFVRIAQFPHRGQAESLATRLSVWLDIPAREDARALR